MIRNLKLIFRFILLRTHTKFEVSNIYQS